MRSLISSPLASSPHFTGTPGTRDTKSSVDIYSDGSAQIVCHLSSAPSVSIGPEQIRLRSPFGQSFLLTRRPGLWEAPTSYKYTTTRPPPLSDDRPTSSSCVRHPQRGSKTRIARFSQYVCCAEQSTPKSHSHNEGLSPEICQPPDRDPIHADSIQLVLPVNTAAASHRRHPTPPGYRDILGPHLARCPETATCRG